VRQEGAFPVFERAFDAFGLPATIRTDNGVPFATQAICGLSKLSVWWIKLGIAHQRIEPGQPQQNGRHERHERMHKTLKRETARPPEQDHQAQQVRFDTWRTEFNQERPHEALGQKTPASLYVPSPRPLPSKLPQPCYPGHFQVRLVSKSSMFRLHHRPIFISEALVNN
jgi:transposase InsO family protein